MSDEPGPNEIQVPAQLRWRGLEQGAPTRGAARGFLGDVLLSAIEVVTGVGKGKAADFVVTKAVQHVDGQVTAGLYALARESLPKLKDTGTPLVQAPAAQDGGPLLVFVHGTFSNDRQHVRQAVVTASAACARAVRPLRRPRLRARPSDARREPDRQRADAGSRLPDRARGCTCVTHSRGGLVAEVLARVCANPTLRRRARRSSRELSTSAQRDALSALAERA